MSCDNDCPASQTPRPPSFALRATDGPPPPLSRWRIIDIIPAMPFASGLGRNTPFPCASPINKGGRAPKDAPPGTASCDAARALAPFSPTAREKTGPPGSPGAGALAFRRPTAVSDKAFDRAGLGLSQRFLESPDANGRTLSGTSAASTSQTGIGPDGHDAQAARWRSVWLRQREPPPLRLQEYPREGVLRERDGGYVTA